RSSRTEPLTELLLLAAAPFRSYRRILGFTGKPCTSSNASGSNEDVGSTTCLMGSVRRTDRSSSL
ncbi:hypothetical protein BHM03_00044712, partial [Ensete ventricosum]